MVRHGGYGRSVALALQALLVPLFGISPDASPFLVFFAAFIAAAWFGGLGPGLVAVGLSALLSRYFSLSPQYSFEIRGFGEGLRLVVFVLEGAVISLLMEAMHAAGRRAKALETTRRWRPQGAGESSRYGHISRLRIGASWQYRSARLRAAHEHT